MNNTKSSSNTMGFLWRYASACGSSSDAKIAYLEQNVLSPGQVAQLAHCHSATYELYLRIRQKR